MGSEAWTGGVTTHRLATKSAPAERRPTVQQWAVMGFLFAFHQKEDRLPNHPEIAAHFEWRSVNASFEHVRSLIRLGLLEKRGHYLRFARTEKGRDALAALCKQAAERGCA